MNSDPAVTEVLPTTDIDADEKSFHEIDLVAVIRDAMEQTEPFVGCDNQVTKTDEGNYEVESFPRTKSKDYECFLIERGRRTGVYTAIMEDRVDYPLGCAQEVGKMLPVVLKRHFRE